MINSNLHPIFKEILDYRWNMQGVRGSSSDEPKSNSVCPKCGNTGRCEPRTLSDPDGQECDCGAKHTTKMKYLRPRLPEKEIELCLDLFDKQEAKKRILKYIEGVLDDAESQLKNCFIHDVSNMKTLKLQVGKTYRSRAGEEVKIIGKDREGKFPYTGSNGEWYTERGRFLLYGEISSRDLIEEVEELPETRHTFDIPDGVKKVTVEQVGNRIVVEMVPEERKEPKPGDVMINIHGNVYIFKEVVGEDVHKCYAWAGEGGRLTVESLCFCGRPATPEEAQSLWDALKKAGKRWNSETMQVEEIPEKEQIEEFLKAYADGVIWSREQLRWLIENYLKHREGEK